MRQKPVFARHLAMDLGTANTLIHLRGQGIVINEPTVVAWETASGRMVAVGREAKGYLGRTPAGIEATRPLKDGVIEDFSRTRMMIRAFFAKVCRPVPFFRPQAVISVPTGITQVEKRAIVQAAVEAGVGKIHLIEEPMAAAIGAGLEIEDARGRLVVDIGGGTTEVAMISRSAIVCGETVRVAGDEMNEAIIAYLQRAHGFAIGENTAEECKMEAGSAWPVAGLPEAVTLSGKDLAANVPAEKTIAADELRQALEEPVSAVVEAVREVIDQAPLQMVDHVRQDGIVLAGGGALLAGLDHRIAKQVGIRCQRTAEPLLTVVQGSAIVLDDLRRYAKVCIA